MLVLYCSVQPCGTAKAYFLKTLANDSKLYITGEGTDHAALSLAFSTQIAASTLVICLFICGFHVY